MKMGTLQKGITNEKKWNKRVQTKNKKKLHGMKHFKRVQSL